MPALLPPLWPEFAVKDIYSRVQADQEFMKYMPKGSALDCKAPERRFFWGVLSTLRPDYVDALIAEARDLRARSHKVQVPIQTLLNVGITGEWARRLL